MNNIPPHVLYDQLMSELQSQGYRNIDPVKFPIEVADTLSGLSPHDAAKVEEYIYSLILHYESLTLNTTRNFRKVALGGKEVSKDCGAIYVFEKLPAPLQQLIALLIREITEG